MTKELPAWPAVHGQRAPRRAREVADHDQVLVGPARDGEAWAAAASAWSATVPFAPVPRPLGPTKRFVVDRDGV